MSVGINNNIEEIRVSFPVAKLLKEAGFDCVVNKCYAEERLIDKNTGGDLFTGVYRLCDLSRFHKRFYYAPTQQLAIDWIRVNFGIHIFVKQGYKWEYVIETVLPCWEYVIETVENKPKTLWNDGLEATPEEAINAALEYTLTNLILKK